MGWTGNEIGKRRMSTREILVNEFSPEFVDRFVDVARVGSVIYGALRSDIHGKDEIVGVVVLTERRNGWLYTKGMDETMGPGESDCPARILDRLTPTEHEYAKAWRERCRENIERRAKSKLAAGDRIRFAEPLRFTHGYGSASLFEYTGKGTQFRALDSARAFTARLGRNWYRRDFEKVAA